VPTAQVNAALTGIYESGGTGEWRDASPGPGQPNPGTALWEGSVGAYLQRKRRTARTTPEVERYVEETLYVDMADPPGVTYLDGLVLRIQSRGVSRYVEVDQVIDDDPPIDDAAALIAAGVVTAALVLRRVEAPS
jgi:hypothetical protein